ncbi:HNH endonuclease signature motif containing protein [Nocardioides mangrovi]|uniref:HNH endonuclease n=1 Tax=Nocardioides mangrovi TaxID=2874580 RepID=A0ABS7U6N5_9ACTN|nr:HNH endonuclease signature motif containing protein [Nocardioides mangrovi]MBZ5736643.1 HNH endonuclease [Nocardioides mangrovi]
MTTVDSGHEQAQVADLDADALLSLCTDAEREVWVAELAKLRCVLQWAHAHPADPTEVARGRVEIAGGDGTPPVEEFTAEPLAAALGASPGSVRQLIADTLDLAHRHPRLWARVERLEVPVWRARRIVQATHHLPADHARLVDDLIAPKAAICGLVTIDKAIAQVTAQTDPTTQDTEEELARRHWDVRLFHGPSTGPGRWVGTSILEITGDTAVLTDLFETLNADAVAAGKAGDHDPIEVRRAKAVAGLGTFSGSRPRRTRLYVHADLADLTDETIGVGSVERLGPLTIARIREWVGHSAVTIVPVIRTDRDDAVERHDPPAWMRELVILRDRHCVFPGCQTDARSCDLDHVIPHEDGGPTSPSNLAALCRHHHRAKTRHRWRYQRRPDQSYLWTDAIGRQYVVDVTSERC